MAAMSNYLENKIIDHIFRGSSYTAPSTLYVALCTSAPNDTSTGSTLSEISGGNYARKAVSASASQWQSTQGNTVSTSSGVAGTTGNVNSITWSSATWSGTVTHIAICDASTSGNVLFYGALSSPKTVAIGDTFQFSANQLQIQFDN